MWANYNKRRGFTIVELLIVIVVIAILAAITIVAYNGIQQRGRDAKRVSDIAVIDRYIKQYIIDNGASPATAPSGCYAARSSQATGCESMSALPNIATYISGGKLPADPTNTATYEYLYYKSYTKSGTGYVGSASPTAYVITTRLESSSETLQTLPSNGSGNATWQFNYALFGQ